MRNSEHYNLNLVEGSDKVNPLVQDVPNYELIDTEMFKNSSATVGVATELKSGTVHALTRQNDNAPMIRFTATSKYNAGDTFTVDGIQVSALMVDGSSLEDGAYIIGSIVLCCLVGTTLTFYGASGKANDSEKLGGELPSFYATKEQLDKVSTVATASSELASENTGKIDTLTRTVNNLGEVEYLLLANGDAQRHTLSKNLSDFRYIRFEIVDNLNSQCYGCMEIPVYYFTNTAKEYRLYMPANPSYYGSLFTVKSSGGFDYYISTSTLSIYVIGIK